MNPATYLAFAEELKERTRIWQHPTKIKSADALMLGTIICSGRRPSTSPWRTQMIGEGEPLQDTDGPSKLDQAKDAVQAATQTVKETTQSVADAIEAGRQPGAPLDRLPEKRPCTRSL
jgi:hypothetical protein